MADGASSTAVSGTLDTPSPSANGMVAPGTTWQALRDLDFLALEFKLVLSAMGIIYVGAHAALRRPPSAAPSKPRRPGQKQQRDGDDDDDGENRFSQGMEIGDAIVFPFLAGIMLVGLYYLIQWLKDPEIINKILRWYMSTMSIVSMVTLYSHAIDLVVSLVFPRYWRPLDGVVRMVDQDACAVRLCDSAGNPVDSGRPSEDSPLPGPLRLLAMSGAARRAAWKLRGLLTQRWIFQVYLHGVGKEKATIKFSHMVALLASLATAIVYSSTTSPFLSNMLGYGLCYGSFLMLSPTDLLIGSLVLVGLFFYDIIMVFYTPYMVTVATTLDAPIKLTFKAAARKSILGLGDIVLPGIMMAWALRLDLWLHYQRKIKYEPTELRVVRRDSSSGDIVTRPDVKHREVKAPYVNVQGAWADRLWVRGFGRWSGSGWQQQQQLPAELDATRFPKTYFHATLVGYGLGMAVTLAMLLVFHHGQPALLYLVPGVLGSLYLTAAVRGELGQVWSYTEDGSLDKKDVVVDLDADGRLVKRLGRPRDGVLDTTHDGDIEAEDKVSGGETKDKALEKDVQKGGHKVFYMSLETPEKDLKVR